MNAIRTCVLLAISGALTTAGCDRADKPAAATTAPSIEESAEAPTNRIDIPEAVRRNLGMTFARVERRAVASTLRLPGAFELPPDARRDYHVAVPGRVEVLVRQYDTVAAGQVLYRLDSPAWRDRVLDLEKARLEIERAAADVEMAEASLAEAKAVAEHTARRIKALAAVDVRRADLDLELSRATSAIPRLEADLRARRAAQHEAQEHYPLLVSAAAAVVGETPEALTKIAGGSEPRWRMIGAIEVRSAAGGVVDAVTATSGGWMETGGHVLTVIRPGAVRFRGSALQSDVARLPAAPTARVSPPGTASGLSAAGTLTIAPTARASERSIDLLLTPTEAPAWARPGAAGLLEVILDTTGPTELAIPLSAVVKDGLKPVIFLRDRRNPDRAIRVEADLGVSDGRYVAVLSDVRAGDEVIVRGAYDLNLATGGSQSKGGHFHPDGTYHEGH